MPHSDFNDLHRVAGLEAVRNQVMAAIEQGAVNDVPPESPPAPSDTGGTGESEALVRALQRYALIHGETKVYDQHRKQVYKQAGMRATLGADTYNAWLKHPQRQTVTWEAVNGEAGDDDPNDPITAMLRRFVHVYPTKSIWDKQKQDLIPHESLKLYLPNEYTRWMEHPNRVTVDQDNIVFDPTQRCDPEVTINTFTGIPLVPDESAKAMRYDACAGILQLLHHLCNEDEEITDWVIRWLAYPLQNVGAKLDTALLFHSDIQGSGKSLFFGRVMTTIYGRYASVLGQHQLESQYTDWRSRLLYAVFEEVLSRTEKHNQMGTIKHMITGPTQRIERKFVSGWEEANHMNAVFLSNEIQPFPLEPSDRRFLVVWPRQTLGPELQMMVSRELDAGGPAAFYQFLLDYPLGDFSPHSKPLDTTARQRVIEFSLPNFEVFFREWKEHDTDIPFAPCLTRDLYHVYQNWCKRTGNRALSETKLVTIYASRLYKTRKYYRISGTALKQGAFFIPDGCAKPQSVAEADWLGECVAEFRLRTRGDMEEEQP